MIYQGMRIFEKGFFVAQEIFPDRSKSCSAASSKLAAAGVSDN